MPTSPTPANRIGAALGAIAFIGLAIASFFIFSYLLIFMALIGLILFVISYVRVKLFGKEIHSQQPHTHHQSSGRIIDQEKD